MASRLGNTEGVLRQNDQLASLGRMAAGIAHEFNNPASAVKRGAVELRDRLAALESAAFELRAIAFDDAQLARLRTLGEPRPKLAEDAMQRARREQALEQAMSARKLPQVWELAPTFAALHWDVAAFDEVAAAFPAAALGPVVRWIEAVSSVRMLASDVADAATRISELVDAVRSHSHLGEAPIQRVDLHHQLDTTLRLLRHKLANVVVRRDYARDLPEIEAFGSELNQVWTNVIDNALQAMEGRPDQQLVVATSRVDAEHVAVAITDNGPGIPAAIQGEVYKPFFTTKPPGAGTGLGLHLSYNIIVRKHRGKLELDSRPGHTCFRVVLPLHAGEVLR
jgi:signal transduction histidine kinase